MVKALRNLFATITWHTSPAPRSLRERFICEAERDLERHWGEKTPATSYAAIARALGRLSVSTLKSARALIRDSAQKSASRQ